MEIIDVKMPSKEEFDLTSYIVNYNGLIIVLNKENKPTGFIVYTNNDEFPYLTLVRNNNIGDDIDVYDDFKELFEENPDIKYLKLIKFNNGNGFEYPIEG